MVTISIILVLCAFVTVGLVAYLRRASERSELCKVLHLPPDSTDQQLQEAQDKSVKKFERLMLGLPLDASDAEAKASSRKLQCDMLDLPSNATDDEIAAAGKQKRQQECV